MSETTYEPGDYEPGDVEDDGVLDASDSLDGDDLRSDVLDTGVDAGDGYRGSDRFGTTLAEERAGEGLDRHLAEEEPDVRPEAPWDDEDVAQEDADALDDDRSGRLVAPDEGAHPDGEPDSVARDVGIDGGGAGAEEAAVRTTDG